MLLLEHFINFALEYFTEILLQEHFTKILR